MKFNNFKIQLQFFKKYVHRTIHLVSCPRIQTCNLSITSILQYQLNKDFACQADPAPLIIYILIGWSTRKAIQRNVILPNIVVTSFHFIGYFVISSLVFYIHVGPIDV